MRLALLGLPCTDCGRPAQFFIEGTHLPCGCGAADDGTRAWGQARDLQRGLLRMAHARGHRLADRDEWDSIAALLQEAA